MRRQPFVVALLALFSQFSLAHAECVPSNDVLASLRCLEGVTVKEVDSPVASGYRQFELTITQETDHKNPGTEQFRQRLVLLHKGWNEPMVLQTSGYSIFAPGLSRLAQTFGANQIQVEHRYFATSTPKSRDWSKLNIEQSAADFHRITTTFKQLYQRRWVGTGASKGGMTSTYHRAFYPNDLDGTVADVAPLSFSIDDERYIAFVDNVGGAKYATCRENLLGLQRELLARRSRLVKKVEGTFAQLESVETAFEHAVIELPFAFWQYGNPTSRSVGCPAIPSLDATDDSLFSFLDSVNEVAGYADEGLERYASYYFQAGTQLGAPGAKLDHLGDLRGSEYKMAQYMPRGVHYEYSNEAMREIERWVTNDAKGVMFVYGEFDPWTAGAYPRVSKAVERDMHFYIAPAANHSAKFNVLSDADQKKAVATLSRWFDKKPVSSLRESSGTSLDELEMAVRRRWRLR